MTDKYSLEDQQDSLEDQQDGSTRTLTTPSEALDDFDLDSPHKAPQDSQRRRWAGGRGILLGVGIGLAIAIVGMQFLAPKSAPRAVKSTQKALPPSMSVTVAPVETTAVARTLDATGTIAAYELVPVLPQTTGLQIREVTVREGESVRAGQVLAVLDNSVLQTQLSQAQAQLEASKAKVQQQRAALAQAQAGIGQAQAGIGQAQATVAQNQASLGQAKRSFQRYKQLADQGAISAQDLDTRSTAVTTAAEAVRVTEANVRGAEAAISSAEANVSSAQSNVSSAQADVRNNEARVQQIKTQLAQTLVLAPASGTLVTPTEEVTQEGSASGSQSKGIARVGDITSGTQKLFSIIRNGIVELRVKIPEIQLKEVPIGATVNVVSNSDNRIRLQGKVREIAPLVDPQSRLATVKIDLPSTSLLKPGMFLQAAITSEMVQGLTIPVKAIAKYQENGKATVYLLEGKDIARSHIVEVGTTPSGDSRDLSKARVEIKSGLKQGDRVIVDQNGDLKDGDRVQIVGG